MRTPCCRASDSNVIPTPLLECGLIMGGRQASAMIAFYMPMPTLGTCADIYLVCLCTHVCMYVMHEKK